MNALHGQGWVVHALGWTLLHFCWQGAAVAGMLWCLLALMGDRAAAMRYGAACGALGLMVAAPLVTFFELAVEARRAGLDGTLPAIEWMITVMPGGVSRDGMWMERLAHGLDVAAPWLPMVWMVGVLLFLARLNVGLMVARGMKTDGTEAVPGELAVRFEVLKARLGVRRVVGLVRSARVQVPTVIGWLRPVVLMPVACLAGLTTEQVEALLVHELAHIRRNDYLVNVLQSVVEAVLFYHPAMWWVSKQVRLERECRCDAMAAEVGGDALGYARALSLLETRRAFLQDVPGNVALGANGGVLTMRIKRLLGYRESSVVSQGVALVLLAGAMAAPGMYWATSARAQEAKVVPAVMVISSPLQQAETDGLRAPYRSWLDEDVAWIIAPEEKSAFLRLTSDAERDHFIAQFWDRRNPKPGLGGNTFRADHYKRIAYANEHFAGKTAGWRSDRGHAFIAYGRPDSIDAHPGSAVPYEVWHYRTVKGLGESVDLKFVDGCQCGEYRLMAQPGLSSVRPATGVVKPVSYGVRVESSVQEPRNVPGGVIAGQLMNRVDPVYPKEAKEKGVSGTVELKAVISAEGTIERLQVMSGPPLLRASAIDAVRQWTYKPYLLNGRAEEVETTITVNYSLGGGDGIPGFPESQNSSSAQGSDSGSGPRRVAGGVMAGQLISHPNPAYPKEAKDTRVQGAVVLKAVISKEGTVENLSVVSGPVELRRSAIDAVRQWVYKPYLLNGEPTEVETTITVNYSFDDATSVVPRHIGHGVSAPVPVRMGDPEYTEEARKDKVSGVVRVNFWVDEHGDPTHVEVTRGIGHGLDEKAIEAVRAYKFKPGMEKGRPVTVAMMIEVDFQMF